MLIRSKRIIVAGFCSFSLAMVSASVFAAESGKTNVMIGGQSAQLSTQYRSELLKDDHGLMKSEGYKPTQTTNILLNELKMGLAGQLTKQSDYAVLLDLNFSAKAIAAGTTPNPDSLIETAQFNWWFTDMVGMGGGKININQGGWDQKHADYAALMNSVYTDSDLPLAANAPAYQLMVKAAGAGNVTLQFTDDVVATAATQGQTTATRANQRFNTANRQPAWTLEYAGDFGGIKPLVQIGSYDINHSRYYAIGLGYAAMGLDAYLDYIQDNRAFHTAATDGGDDKKLTDTHTTYTIDVGYTIPKVARPFVKYSGFNVKDATSSDAVGVASTETKNNAQVGTSSTVFADNATQWALGSSFLMEGNHFRPYLALVNYSGKFDKGDGTDSGESKSNMMIKLGVMGEF